MDQQGKVDVLDLSFVNNVLMGDIKVSCLGHSDHEIIEFNIFSEIKKMVSIVGTFDFKKANFKLLWEVVSRAPWESDLKLSSPQELLTF